MTRYFYTDPLASAWMAKHFGMKIAPDPREFPNPGDASFDEQGVMMQASLATMVAPQWRKWYVHPDSLHLLERQVKDVIQSDRGNVNRISYFNDEGKIEDDDDFTWEIKDAKIIQRNGIPFMWPESEEA